MNGQTNPGRNLLDGAETRPDELRGFSWTHDMRTTVLDEGRQFDRQTHAYAEYRVFSTLASDGSSHRDVTVTLTRMEGNGSAGRPVVCTVAVTMESGDVAKVHALERHAYGAIDRAAVLITRAIQRRRGQRLKFSTPDASQQESTGGHK